MADQASEIRQALKGLRLVSISSGPEGFGFRMYTNRNVEGQHIEAVTPGGPADLAGIRVDDHILQVDGVDISEDSHKQVVARIKAGGKQGKSFLVIDPQTEKEMKERGIEPSPDKATVTLEMQPIDSNTCKEEDTLPEQVEECDAGPLQLGSMDDARPRKPKKREVMERDWAASVKAYSEL